MIQSTSVCEGFNGNDGLQSPDVVCELRVGGNSAGADTARRHHEGLAAAASAPDEGSSGSAMRFRGAGFAGFMWCWLLYDLESQIAGTEGNADLLPALM